MAMRCLMQLTLLVATLGTKEASAACARGPGRGGQEVLDASSFLQLATESAAALTASGAGEAAPFEDIAKADIDLMKERGAQETEVLKKFFERGEQETEILKKIIEMKESGAHEGGGEPPVTSNGSAIKTSNGSTIEMEGREVGEEDDDHSQKDHADVHQKAIELEKKDDDHSQKDHADVPQKAIELEKKDAGASGERHVEVAAAATAANAATAPAVQSPTPLAAVPSDYVSWLSSDASDLTLTGGTVTAVTDKNPSSSIATFGAPSWSAQDGFALSPTTYFQMNNVRTAGTWTVFVAFKYSGTSNACMMGADPGGYGRFDTGVCFGHAGNPFMNGIQPGVFWMSTHYGSSSDPRNGGVTSGSKAFNDGNWHWVQIYGGDNPHMYSLRFDTGDYYTSTGHWEGWMRDNIGFYIGRAQSANFYGNVKDVIVYNRHVPDAEAASVHAFMDSVINGQATMTTTATTSMTATMTTTATTSMTATMTTTATAASDQSSVVGDPHIVNVAQERFEIRAQGVHKLVQIPRFIPANKKKPDLRVDAKIEHLASRDCSKSFLTSMEIFGQWTEDAFGLVRITQGSDMPNTTLLINTQGPEEYFRRFPHTDFEAGPASITFKLRGVSFHVAKHFEGRYGKQQAYLNLRVAGLKNYKDVGGLLGHDDHADAEKLPANCTAARPAVYESPSFVGAGRSAPVTDGGSRIEAE